MADQDKCKHKFRHRYNEIYTTGLEQLTKNDMGTIEGGYALTESYLQQKIYIHDICIKCGLVIEPNEKK